MAPHVCFRKQSLDEEIYRARFILSAVNCDNKQFSDALLNAQTAMKIATKLGRVDLQEEAFEHCAQVGYPVRSDTDFQGCQIKISIKSQTMQKRGQKKPNFICGIAIPLSQKTSKSQEYQKILFEIKIKSCLVLRWSTDLPWLFMVCEIAYYG